jgi:hypothetical protein
VSCKLLAAAFGCPFEWVFACFSAKAARSCLRCNLHLLCARMHILWSFPHRPASSLSCAVVVFSLCTQMLQILSWTALLVWGCSACSIGEPICRIDKYDVASRKRLHCDMNPSACPVRCLCGNQSTECNKRGRPRQPKAVAGLRALNMRTTWTSALWRRSQSW